MNNKKSIQMPVDLRYFILNFKRHKSAICENRDIQTLSTIHRYVVDGALDFEKIPNQIISGLEEHEVQN